MKEPDRELSRALAAEYAAKENPTGWFDALYRTAAGNYDVIPWADRAPNPLLTDWCHRESRPVPGSRVVVVGCGLGDDAEYLASRGAAVTAFDISARAIAWCQERFPNSPVRYVNADLLQLPADLMEAFDLVVECYTVQALPPSLQQAAIAAVATLVAPGGELIIACRGRDATDPPGILPYPLTRRDLDAVPWQQLHWEDFDDPYQPGTRRFRAHWKRV